MFRLFRLSIHCHRLKIIGLIVADSLRDLQLFLICLLIIVTLDGDLMYYLEQGVPETLFSDIPKEFIAQFKHLLRLAMEIFYL